jgi:hypothetical protein
MVRIACIWCVFLRNSGDLASWSSDNTFSISSEDVSSESNSDIAVDAIEAGEWVEAPLSDADKERSTGDLLAELSGLRMQFGQIEGQKIDLVTQAGGGATGASNMTNLGGVSLNAQMMEASGAGRIQARIGVIKGVLADRGVDVPAAD